MITILFHMTVKPECKDEFRDLARSLTTSTHEKDPGCLAYAYYAQADDEKQAVLFEQWMDQDSLNAHVARLVSEIGPPATDKSLPASHYRRRLPAAFLDLFSETSVVRYETLA